MLHTAHHAIKVRLTMWKTFFETGYDASPEGATDSEYGLDRLIELARISRCSTLHDLADVVELMGQNYILRMDSDIADALMRDDPAGLAPGLRHATGATDAELAAALAG